MHSPAALRLRVRKPGPGSLRMSATWTERDHPCPSYLSPLNRITKPVPEPILDLCPKLPFECSHTRGTPDNPFKRSFARPRWQNQEPVDGHPCTRSLSFGVACYPAVVTETVAIWRRCMTKFSSMIGTPLSPVILETFLHVEGKHVEAGPESQDTSHSNHGDSWVLLWKLELNCLPPWLIHLSYCHFSCFSPSITDGGSSCQNKLGQAAQPENTNCLDVFVCVSLDNTLFFILVESSQWGPGVTGEWRPSQRHQLSP